MKNNPNFNRKELTLLKVNLGSLYLFDDYVVVELKERVDINFDIFSEVTEIIKKQFIDKPFGFIANRLKSYSINIMDTPKFNAYFSNLVAYTEMTQRIFELENHLFTFNREAFKNLEHAVQWVEKTLSINS